MLFPLQKIFFHWYSSVALPASECWRCCLVLACWQYGEKWNVRRINDEAKKLKVCYFCYSILLCRILPPPFGQNAENSKNQLLGYYPARVYNHFEYTMSYVCKIFCHVILLINEICMKSHVHKFNSFVPLITFQLPT